MELLRAKFVLMMFLLGMLISCSKPMSQKGPAEISAAQTGHPRNSVDVVKATASEVVIKAGEDGDAIVQLNIEKGYHVNANPPTFSYLKATELEIPPAPGVSVSFIVYPDPITKSFPFAEKPLAVYEGLTTIKAKLKANRAAKTGLQNLPSKLRVQACDDQVCYAPGTLDISIPLSIK